MAKSPTQIAHDRAWKAFSKYIRARDGRCVTCGAGAENAGHFWHGLLDFDEVNVNAQCVRCNKWLSGNLAPYAIYLINKHGTKEFKNLEKRKYEAKKGEKRYPDELLAIEKKYKEKLLNLQSGGLDGDEIHI